MSPVYSYAILWDFPTSYKIEQGGMHFHVGFVFFCNGTHLYLDPTILQGRWIGEFKGASKFCKKVSMQKKIGARGPGKLCPKDNDIIYGLETRWNICFCICVCTLGMSIPICISIFNYVYMSLSVLVHAHVEHLDLSSCNVWIHGIPPGFLPLKPCSVRPFLANDAIHEVSGTGFDCPLSQHRAVKGTMFNMHFLSDPSDPNNDWQMKWSAKHLYMVHEGSADQCQFPGSSPRSRDFSIKKKCWPKKPTERFGPQNTAFFSSHFTCGDGHLLLVPSSLAENEGNPRSGSPGCWSSAEHKRSQSKHPVLPVRVWRNISTNKKLTGIQFPKLGQHAASDSSSATGSVGLAKRTTASQVKRWSYIFKNSFFAFHFWKKILPNSKKVDL